MLRTGRLLRISGLAMTVGWLLTAGLSAMAEDRFDPTSISRGGYSESTADRYQDGMVTGNGLDGMLHHGPPADQRVVMCSHRFVVPNGAPLAVPDMVDRLAELRDRMLAGDIGPAYQDYHDELLRRRGLPVVHKPYYGMVSTQPLHAGLELVIQPTDAKESTNFGRWTDYRTGQITARWTDRRGVVWHRHSFASRADGRLYTLVRCDRPDGCRVRLSLAPPDAAPDRLEFKASATAMDHATVLDAALAYPPIQGHRGGYGAACRVSIAAGNLSSEQSEVVIDDAAAVLIVTVLNRFDDADKVASWLDEERVKGNSDAGLPPTEAYARALDAHVAIVGPIYDRSELTLTDRDLSVTNEALLRRESSDRTSIDPELLQRLYDNSRYLFLISSGERYAPRLSGLFTGSWRSAWAGDYTCDANVNLAVLGGNIADLPECMAGYESILTRTLPQWREAAEKFYGCRGILGPIRIDGEYATPLHLGPYHAHFTATGLGPWLIYPLWERYQITGDRTFLREILYPLMVEQATFYEDFLTRTDQNDQLVFVPSNSPENADPAVKPRTTAAINSVMDIAACKQLLTNVLRAREELEVAPDEQSHRWRKLLERLPPYLVDDGGVLKEWAWPSYGENRRHRHLSHLYPVWPLYEIHPENPDTAELIPAVAAAIDARPKQIEQAHGGLNKAIGWLRLKRADGFREELKHFLENGYFYDGLCSSHNRGLKIYNYDLALCLQGLLIEMAVFSDDTEVVGGQPVGTIELLPALPADLSSGRLTGVRTRCQTRIAELSWSVDETALIECVLTSRVRQSLVIRHRGGISSVSTEVQWRRVDDNTIVIDVEAGERNQLRLNN